MNANTTTQVTLGKGKVVHAGTRTDENGAFNPQPVCAGAKAGRYVETTAEVTCKRCLKALADEAAREAAYQDRLAASMEPVTEAHDFGYVPADEPATVAAEQPAEVREIREAAEADADMARRTEDLFRSLVADMGPYDDEDNDDYEPDEDELNDPLIRRGALAVAADMTGYTFRDDEDGFCTFGNLPDVAGSGCIRAAGHPGQHEVSDGVGQTTFQATTDEPEAPQAGFCTFGVTAAHGSGCIQMAGHTGAHNVADGGEDEAEDAPITVTLGMSDTGRPLVQGPGGLKGEAVGNSSGQWSVTDADHKFVIVDAPDFLTALEAWSVFMGLDVSRVEFVNGLNATVTMKDEQNGTVDFAGLSADVTRIGRMWAVHNEDGAVLSPMREDLLWAVADWANGLYDVPWKVCVEMGDPAEV
jgi:hypothetical protein